MSKMTFLILGLTTIVKFQYKFYLNHNFITNFKRNTFIKGILERILKKVMKVNIQDLSSKFSKILDYGKEVNKIEDNYSIFIAFQSVSEISWRL